MSQLDGTDVECGVSREILSLMVQIMWEHAEATAIVERLCFALGNTTVDMISVAHKANRLAIAHCICSPSSESGLGICLTGLEVLIRLFSLLSQEPLRTAPALTKVFSILVGDDCCGRNILSSKR